MSIQITINGENASEALTELSTLAAGFAGGQAIPSPEAPKTSRSRSSAKPETVKPDKQPDPEPEQADEDQTPNDSDAPIPTDIELRATAQEKGKTPAGKAAIKALLNKYGVPNITGVPDDERIAFHAELEAI